MEGNAEEIMGKHFEIRKVCDRAINDNQRESIRDFCNLLVGGACAAGPSVAACGLHPAAARARGPASSLCAGGRALPAGCAFLSCCRHCQALDSRCGPTPCRKLACIAPNACL